MKISNVINIVNVMNKMVKTPLSFYKAGQSSLERGVALMSAVFVIVILSLVAVYIVGLSIMSSASANLFVQGTRAYYAAQSGLEWASQQASTGGACANCAASTTFAFSQPALTGYSAKVTCSCLLVTEASTYGIYTITSTGFTGTQGTAGYAARTLVRQTLNPVP
jgi:MSHA biogenesis protein MshP